MLEPLELEIHYAGKLLGTTEEANYKRTTKWKMIKGRINYDIMINYTNKDNSCIIFQPHIFTYTNFLFFPMFSSALTFVQNSRKL